MKAYLILVLLLLFCSDLFSQNDESIVAKVGDRVITSKEFKIRFDLSPFIPSNRNIDTDSIKYDFLYSLISEELWYKEAEKLGFHKTVDFNFYLRPLEDLFVRDALFKLEVKDKVILSANDINNGIAKLQTKLKTQIISTSDSTEIYKVFKYLTTLSNFDSLKFNNNNLELTDTEIVLGKLRDEEIEDSLYSMQINEFTTPIKSEMGWVIFRIIDQTFTPVDISDSKITSNIKDIIRNRRIEKRYRKYLDELLSGIKININPESFNLINSSVWDKLNLHNSEAEKSKNYFELNEKDFKDIISSLGKENYSKPLFDVSDRKITIFDFLASLAFEGFNVTMLDQNNVKIKLNQKVKHFVESQIITNEAYKRGLQLNTEVNYDLNKWKMNYLAQMYFLSNRDSIKVTESEVYNYYTNDLVNSSNIKLINLRLLMLNNLEEVGSILEQLNKGIDFGSIVKRYGKTDSLVNSDAETGLKPVLLLGDIGKIASGLKLNEIYGPIKRENSYCIFQVIEEETTNDSLKLSFNSVKNQLKSELKDQKLLEMLNKRTALLAEKYRVKIFPEELKNVNISNVPMFVHRLMGFGGRIAGVPLLTPFSGWINKEGKVKLLP
jgi:parvulin-like peptidyl-prolyl isomerase